MQYDLDDMITCHCVMSCHKKHEVWWNNFYLKIKIGTAACKSLDIMGSLNMGGLIIIIRSDSPPHYVVLWTFLNLYVSVVKTTRNCYWRTWRISRTIIILLQCSYLYSRPLHSLGTTVFLNIRSSSSGTVVEAPHHNVVEYSHYIANQYQTCAPDHECSMFSGTTLEHIILSFMFSSI